MRSLLTRWIVVATPTKKNDWKGREPLFLTGRGGKQVFSADRTETQIFSVQREARRARVRLARHANDYWKIGHIRVLAERTGTKKVRATSVPTWTWHEPEELNPFSGPAPPTR